MKSRLLKNYIREVVGDYSMSSTRRMQAPGNIRSGFMTTGSRSSLMQDLERDTGAQRQDEDSLPKVALCLVSKGGKYLAVSRGDNLNDMNLPGGMVELGEEPIDAASRELFEETGLKAVELSPIYSKVDRGKLVSVFRVLKFTGNLRGSSEGTPSWVSSEALSSGRFGEYFQKMMTSIT